MFLQTKLFGLVPLFTSGLATKYDVDGNYEWNLCCPTFADSVNRVTSDVTGASPDDEGDNSLKYGEFATFNSARRLLRALFMTLAFVLPSLEIIELLLLVISVILAIFDVDLFGKVTHSDGYGNPVPYDSAEGLSSSINFERALPMRRDNWNRSNAKSLVHIGLKMLREPFEFVKVALNVLNECYSTIRNRSDIDKATCDAIDVDADRDDSLDSHFAIGLSEDAGEVAKDIEVRNEHTVVEFAVPLDLESAQRLYMDDFEGFIGDSFVASPGVCFMIVVDTGMKLTGAYDKIHALSSLHNLLQYREIAMAIGSYLQLVKRYTEPLTGEKPVECNCCEDHDTYNNAIGKSYSYESTPLSRYFALVLLVSLYSIRDDSADTEIELFLHYHVRYDADALFNDDSIHEKPLFVNLLSALYFDATWLLFESERRTEVEHLVDLDDNEIVTDCKLLESGYVDEHRIGPLMKIQPRLIKCREFSLKVQLMSMLTLKMRNMFAEFEVVLCDDDTLEPNIEHFVDSASQRWTLRS